MHRAAEDIRAPRASRACAVDSAGVPPRAIDGVLARRATLGLHTGFAALEQALLECAYGRSELLDSGSREVAMFVLGGRGMLHVDTSQYELEPETGISLGPHRTYRLESSGPEALRLVAVEIPDPGRSASAQVVGISRLADQATVAATTSREFRIVADAASGLSSATHFVGYIPALRAPEHFHTYDEVIYVLDGHGTLHVQGEHHPLAAGSCVQLPAHTVHCLENTDVGVMRVVAVFRPSGSPAEAYYPDGTRVPVEPAQGP